jgi:hypothetical protein
MAKRKVSNDTGVPDQHVAVEATEVSPEVVTPLTPKEATLARLSPYDQKLSEFAPYLDLKISGAADKEIDKKIEEARKEVKRTRVEAEKVGKEIVAPFNAVVSQINARRNEVEDGFTKIEKHLQSEHDKFVKLEEEQIRLQKEAAEAKFQNRLDQLRTLGAEWNGVNAFKMGELSLSVLDIRSMDDEDFIQNTTQMEAIYEQERLAREAKAEADRLAAEKEKAERAKIEEANAKLEKEKADLQKKLDDMLKEKAAVALAAQKEQEKKDAEAAAVQAEKDKQAAEDEKNRQALKFNLRKSDLMLTGLKEDEFGSFSHNGKTLVKRAAIEQFDDEEWSNLVNELPNTIQKLDDEAAEAEEAIRLEKIKARHKFVEGHATELDAHGNYLYKDVQLISSHDVDTLTDDAWLARFSDIVSRVGNLKAKEEEEKERLRLEALKPDQDKLRALINKLRVECSKVKLNTEPGKEIVGLILADIDRNEEAILNLK